MGKLFSWSLSEKDSKNCGRCGMLKSSMGGHCVSFNDGCCQDRQAHVQLDKDQKATEDAYIFSALTMAALPVSIATIPDHYVDAYITGYPTTNAPPEPDKVPLFIHYCIFRI
jgi:hypothetical protein